MTDLEVRIATQLDVLIEGIADHKMTAQNRQALALNIVEESAP